MNPLSRRVLSIEESATLAVSDRAARLKAQGVDVISLSAGEPDFDTPEPIKQAAIDALARGMTKYTATAGIPALRQAVAAKFLRDNGLTYAPEQVLVSCGAKHSIYNLLHALLDEGDEAIIPAPYWTSYPEMVKTTGARPVIVPTSEPEGFKMGAERLRGAVTPRTKLVILCSPSNPTGAVYAKAELEALSEVIIERGLYVISDEVYERMIYGGAPHVSIASLGKEIFDRTLVVNSCSKTFAMTGWRIGYAAGPRLILDAAAKLQGQATSNPTSIAQAAAVAALQGDPSGCLPMIEEYARRREYVSGRLSAMPGLSLVKPDGAFYAFPRVSGCYGRRFRGEPVTGSVRLCELLLESARVALVPGAAFGDDAYVRISYASAQEQLAQGLDRMEAFFQGLSD